MEKEFKCPKCKKTVIDFPAISRDDDKTEICSACGVQEALVALNKAKKMLKKYEFI